MTRRWGAASREAQVSVFGCPFTSWGGGHKRWPSFRRAVLALVVAVPVAICPEAWAQGGSERTAIVSTLERLKRDPDARSVASRAISEAESALKRSDATKQAGELTRTRLLEALARKWAQSAEDLTRAHQAERSATRVEQRLLEAQERLLRARALLEEGMARVERARAALAKLARERGADSKKDTRP